MPVFLDPKRPNPVGDRTDLSDCKLLDPKRPSPSKPEPLEKGV